MSTVREQRLSSALELYHQVADILARAASLATKLQLAVLILSVVTSGSLWLLLSKAVPEATLWFGAIVSTVTTGLTLYLKSSGLNKKRTKALDLYRDLGQFLAEVRASETLDDTRFWDEYKKYEGQDGRLTLWRPRSTLKRPQPVTIPVGWRRVPWSWLCVAM